MTQYQTIQALKKFLKDHELNLCDLGVRGYIEDAIGDAEFTYDEQNPSADHGTASGESDASMLSWHNGRVL